MERPLYLEARTWLLAAWASHAPDRDCRRACFEPLMQPGSAALLPELLNLVSELWPARVRAG